MPPVSNSKKSIYSSIKVNGTVASFIPLYTVTLIDFKTEATT